MTLCSTLKYLREDKNLMQKDIAKLLEITPSAYGYYEQDKRQPDPETLRKLADFYNVSTDYLLGRTDFPDPPSNPREIIAPHREGDQFADLPPEAIAEIQMHIDYVRHKYKKQQPDDKK
jgi:transcriptional regulator with XRE-family HTH domain